MPANGLAQQKVSSVLPDRQEQSLSVGWYSSFYRYQTNEAKTTLKPMFLKDYIIKHVDRESIFAVHLFPPLVDKKVKTYRFAPKFRVPSYPEIKFVPRNSAEETLNAYQDFMQGQQLSKSYADVFSKRYFIAEAHDRFMFTHLSSMGAVWDSIPDAPKLGEDGFLERRSAQAGIRTLLHNHSYETQTNLEKISIKTGPWTFEGTENILLSQGYVDNWVKGGESNVSLGSDLRLTANYKKNKHEWDNYIIHKVGIVSTETEKGKVNTDLIELNTKYGLKASQKWYYSFLYNFKTQFFYGYDKPDGDPVSGFLAPAYMSFAVGMDYKPDKKFTLLLSPITSRLTLVANTRKFDETDYGIQEGRNGNIVNGISVVNNISHNISREFKLSSRLDAFYQYLGKPDKDKDRRVQIDWEVILDMKINRFLSTRILGHLRYFTNESDKVQLRENFNINFSYNF
ncbi:DUF3078 domain-containing protein [Carboxylicivirga sp. N1E11]